MCRVCCSLYAKEFRTTHAEAVRLEKAAYYARNRERERLKSAKYYAENKERIKVVGAAYYQKNKVAISERTKVYLANGGYALQYKRYNERIATDPSFKVKENLRSRMRQAVKGNNKSASTLELLGCTPEELRAHLESQFRPEMRWETYGKDKGEYTWVIDHRVPICAFDMLEPEEQRKAFHYTNLQPLFELENLQKGARLPENNGVSV